MESPTTSNAKKSTVDALVIDLLEWLSKGPQTYDDVLEGWRTSCPRLPVWEEANDRGFINQGFTAGRGRLVSLSPEGVTYLQHSQSRATTNLLPAA
jgi:D-3-phosphoglycerate dehydrogenase